LSARRLSAACQHFSFRLHKPLLTGRQGGAAAVLKC